MSESPQQVYNDNLYCPPSDNEIDSEGDSNFYVLRPVENFGNSDYGVLEQPNPNNNDTDTGLYTQPPSPDSSDETTESNRPNLENVYQQNLHIPRPATFFNVYDTDSSLSSFDHDDDNDDGTNHPNNATPPERKLIRNYTGDKDHPDDFANGWEWKTRKDHLWDPLLEILDLKFNPMASHHLIM